VYYVKGADKAGTWEGVRRYNEFFVLYNAMVARWPAIYIPKVPPKKTIVFLINRVLMLANRVIKT
jgi:hypothetical protein